MIEQDTKCPVDLLFRILTITDPTLKKFFIFFNTSISLICNSIEYTGIIRIPNNLDLSFAILTEKVDSASEKPVTLRRSLNDFFSFSFVMKK